MKKKIALADSEWRLMQIICLHKLLNKCLTWYTYKRGEDGCNYYNQRNY